MGLLDNLHIGHNANFGGQGGGLLDFLRTSQMQQDQYQPSQGFSANPMDANAQMQAAPINIGSYQMPRIGDQAQFTPASADPAALPPNAQPTQGQMPPQALGGDSYMDRINGGGSLIGSLFGSPPSNQTAQFLVSKGMDPAMAKTVVSDPALLRSVLPQIMGMGGQTDDIKEYQFAKKEDPSLTFTDFMQQKRSTTGKYGMQGYWGSKNGKPSLIQLGKDGVPVEVSMPEGFELAKEPYKVDTGTHINEYDPQTRALIRSTPKDLVGKESAEKIGQAQGTAKVALPAAEKTTERAIRMIDELEKHKGFGSAVGFVMGRLPALTPDAADFHERVAQVDAMVFGDAVEVMRGLGALTEREGPKITAARARLNTAKSEADYKTAINDIREVFKDGIENMRQKAGASGGGTTASPKRIRINADGTIAQ